MAAAPIVAILAAAAEAFAKKLGESIGEGIVDTLFHQADIDRNLDEIKRMLEELSDFIRNRLPLLIERSVDLAFARKAQYDVAEKASSIMGSIAALQKATKDRAPARQIDFIVSELAVKCDAILELGGTLIEYGQPYYASVGIAFAAALKGYAEIVKVTPARAEALRSLTWKKRISRWLEPGRQSSLVGALNWLQARYDLGKTCVPSFETWNTHTTREVAISWQDYDGQVFVSGAWFGYWQDKGLQGDTLGRMLAPGLTFEKAVAEGKLQYTIPEWWTVKANVPASMADYEECANGLGTLIIDYYSYAELAPTAKSAVALMQDVIAKIDVVMDNTDDLAAAARKLPPRVTSSSSDEEKLKFVEAVLQQNRPGIGLTRRF